MDNAKISKLTQEVIKEATRIHKEHSTSDEDTIFIANAFLNATKILYTQALGEEVATSLLLEVMRQSFGDESRTLH
jgi:predicted nucleic acid-binding protein